MAQGSCRWCIHHVAWPTKRCVPHGMAIQPSLQQQKRAYFNPNLYSHLRRHRIEYSIMWHQAVKLRTKYPEHFPYNGRRMKMVHVNVQNFFLHAVIFDCPITLWSIHEINGSVTWPKLILVSKVVDCEFRSCIHSFALITRKAMLQHHPIGGNHPTNHRVHKIR